MSVLILGATILDGVADHPIEGQAIWIEGGRIRAVGRPHELATPPTATVVDASGKYAIPGLMNANVHLLCDVRVENLARYETRYEDLIAESAQLALKNGITTLFDTWGPRRSLMAVRDRINAGQTAGSRIFCAGNIIGFDGPFSDDFIARAAEFASAPFVRRINATWVENVGRHLMWLTPEQVAREVRTYIEKGIDFVKFASNEHYGSSAGAFLAFSPQVQAAIVEEAHRAGLTAQAHSTSVEGLRIAIDAGCDLIQHANITGPVSIPPTTLEGMMMKRIGAVVFPWTQRGLEWATENLSDKQRAMWSAADVNVRNLIGAGVMLLLGNDGAVFAPEMAADPAFRKSWLGAPREDNLVSLEAGHFVWFKAMEEKGCPPMEMLKAATRDIARAYGKDEHLGTLEPGKRADVLILDSNPLKSAANYQSIHLILKDGVIVDRDALPVDPILTKPVEDPAEEEASYVPFVSNSRFLTCPMCMGG